MSLVNDALRRAKESDRTAPPPPPSQLHFRPVEPAQHTRQTLGLMVPATLGLLALLALFLAWQWAQGRKPGAPSQARALTPAAASAAPVPRQSPPALASVPARAPAPEPSTPPVVAPAAPAQPAAAISADQTNEVTNATASVAALVPKPAPLRLQAIVYDPKRPSALISGKSVFIGEKVGDARVVAIDQESATLVSAGKTNVLNLME